jgi:hypothetical protein
MSRDATSNITWQKVAVLTAVISIAFPVVARFAWEVVFPPDFLLYEITPTISVGDYRVGALVITNAGRAVQNNIAVYIPARSIDPESTTVELSGPRRASWSYLWSLEPDTPIEAYIDGESVSFSVGTLAPGEEVRITFVEERNGLSFSAGLGIRDARVESSSAFGKQADGIRYPEHDNSLHSFYFGLAPYLLAFILSLIFIGIVAAIIFESLFDTPRKKMTRLWREMDNLQEIIDKERRYE